MAALPIADRPEVIRACDERTAAPERTHAALSDVKSARVCLRFNSNPTENQTAERVT